MAISPELRIRDRKAAGPHADEQGWFDAFPGALLTLGSGGVFDLHPMTDDPAAAAGPQVLRVAKPGTDDFYYLSYRQPVGYDDGLTNSYTKGINIHTHPGYGRTRFIRTLTDGELFEDDPVHFTQLGRAGDHSYVTVEVLIGGCGEASPSLGIDPSLQITAAIQAAKSTSE